MKSLRKKLLISLHGIKTRGEWQKEFCPYVSELGWKYYPLDYNYFTATQLLIPPFRTAKYRWFREKVNRIAADNPGTLPSIVVHSFGSLILANALLRFPDLKFDKIVLTGSIIPRNFPWETIYKRGQFSEVLNIVGEGDVWSKTADLCVYGAGGSGAYGFVKTCLIREVQQYEYAAFGHSDAHSPDVFTARIIPFLEAPPLSGACSRHNYLTFVPPLNAACWTAVTYHRQFIARFLDAVRDDHFYDRMDTTRKIETPTQLVVLIPERASHASKFGRAQLCKELGLKEIAFGKRAERTALINKDGVVYDLPSAIDSFGVYSEVANCINSEAVALRTFHEILQDAASQDQGPVGPVVVIKPLSELINPNT